MSIRSRFYRLQTKLTVLYAALFGLTLMFISAAVYATISYTARDQVRGELTASGTVFDRVWSLRSEQLRQGATLLSRDFGFREAVSTGDGDTIVSAMENLRQRMGIDLTFIVRVDGEVVAENAAAIAPDADVLLNALYNSNNLSGVAIIGGAPCQIIAAPILSPDLKGWVVFALRLDRREMTALQKLSAIPIEAEVLHKTKDGWTAEGRRSPLDAKLMAQFVDRSLSEKDGQPGALSSSRGKSFALVKVLPTLNAPQSAVLLLRYPMRLAFAPYNTMLLTIALTGLAGLGVVIWGSWALARSLTLPISRLDDAAHRLQRGEDAHVDVESSDEIGRLGDSFNHMAAEIRERERKITHLALHDSESGLPSRLSLERRLAERRSDGRGANLYLVALGVDRFAHVRGAIGYELAAEAIGIVGGRLGELVAAEDLARLSTDILGCVIVAGDEAAAEARCLSLLAELERPITLAGEQIDIMLTVGLSPCDGDADPIERASIALDQARAARRKLATFDAKAYGDPSTKLALMSGLLNGLENGEVELFHQAKYDVRQRRVSGVEALVRWRRGAHGMLPPDLFIPLAEETGHIRALTDWVLRRAIDDQRELAAAGFDLMMSVNISGRLLGDREFSLFALAEVAKAVGVICFEITETAVIENPAVALEILDQFDAAGIHISIDDFGSGLSSLAYLKRIRAHELKIDKSIIDGIGQSQRDALIVRSTIDLSHGLGLKVTAEGVETAEVFALLAGMGCDLIQGYLIARPQPRDELLAFLQTEAAQARKIG